MENLIIGSHNSFTYAPAKSLLMKLIRFTACCQDLNIEQQWNSGVRLFDIRLWFSPNGDYNVWHGIIKFDIDVDEIFRKLEEYGKKDNVFCRVWLEETNYRKSEKIENWFIDLCDDIEKKYPHVRFFDGCRKFDGKSIYSFRQSHVNMIGKYSSVTTLFKEGTSWWNRLLRIADDWFPRFYAWRMNRHNMEMYSNGKFDNPDEQKQYDEGAIIHIDFAGKYY